MKVKDRMLQQEFYQEPPDGIRFQINQYDPPIPCRVNGKDRRIKGIITCSIDHGEYSGSGTSYCSHLDTWDRFKGKKLAFERALDMAAKDFRRLQWEDFLSQHKPPQPDGD